ncbi:hypothetical protein H696_03116 [Fonticula alba]|uniref:Uncharacterized protein n=1 Tax=Fonticula alba TaxID=691883 RepID=A0A058ZBG4_FONAL|nr:hypothetical protein H696_03116 [Fonticula alba]KCV70767.1 hypothetical protein H696_03116 [Fonticula alba]|eukprot:XP_009495283.1 hypothetical protein H696_03116 [Fonticula alba]
MPPSTIDEPRASASSQSPAGGKRPNRRRPNNRSASGRTETPPEELFAGFASRRTVRPAPAPAESVDSLADRLESTVIAASTGPSGISTDGVPETVKPLASATEEGEPVAAGIATEAGDLKSAGVSTAVDIPMGASASGPPTASGASAESGSTSAPALRNARTGRSDRPAFSMHVARRMIENELEISMAVSDERKAFEREQLDRAREERRVRREQARQRRLSEEAPEQ